MKINLIIIFLIASLALNIVFFIKANTIVKEEQNPIKKTTIINNPIIKETSNLSKIQRYQLKKIIKEFKIALSEYKNQILSKRIDIIDELSNPDFSLENLKKATEELNKSENEFNLYFVESLGKISKVMNPEQRIKLLIKFSRHWFFFKDNKHRRGRR